MTGLAPALVRLSLGTAAVAAAVVAVLLLHGRVSNGADDRAWAVVLAHNTLGWNVAATVISSATPSLGGGAALLLVAAVLSVRSRRWTPLAVVVAAVLLLGIVVAGGKLLLLQGGVAGDRGYRIPGPRWPSGPATTAAVVGGVAALLLRGRVRWVGWFVALAVVVVLLNGAAEVFLGQHRLSDVVASWAAGLAIAAVVGLTAGPRLRALPDGPFLPALVHLLAGTALARPFHRAHAWLLRCSGGRLGSRWVDGSRLLVLEVAGRHVPVAYVEHSEGFVVTAANAGRAAEPAWLRRLRGAGSAVVHVRGRAVPVVPDESRRDELWPLVVRRIPAAAEYAQLAGRPLPVVLLRRS